MSFDDEIPGAKSSLTDQLARWGVNARRRHVIGAEVVFAPLLLVVMWPAWWVALIVGLLILVVATLTYGGATAAGWVARLVRFVWYRRSASARQRRAAVPEPFTVDLSGIGSVGMRWDGQYVITMIALHGRAYSPTVLIPAGAKTEDMVPIDQVAGLLRQFGGLELAAVDVVSAGRRTSSARYAAIYDEIIGDRPAVGLRQTWLVLRLCPQVCLDAMAYRGDAAAAAAAATERIRQAVLRTGCRATTCTADQMTAATRDLIGSRHDAVGGGELGAFRESWSQVEGGGDYVTTYRLAGRDLTTETINDLWAVRSDLTVLTVRIAATGAGAVTAGAVVRFHTAQQLTHPPLLSLQSVAGQAYSALLASLPLGNRSLAMQTSARRLDPGQLEIPLGPAGFMLGTTNAGYPLLLGLHDPLKATRVSVGAELAVIEQLVLRATATGSRVLVHTSRPHVWAPICGEHVVLADADQPLMGPVNMVVVDIEPGTQAPSVGAGERGHTLLTVTATPMADTDLTIRQVSPGELRLSTPRLADVPLRLLRPRNEAQFLTHLHSAPEAAPVGRRS